MWTASTAEMASETSIDPRALAAHRGFLRALARRLVADEHRAEDVVQETWLRALQKPPRSSRALRSWLARVAANLARKTATREGERPERERRAARPESDDGRARSDFELQHALAGALRGLPEPYRTTVHLRYWKELSPRAIAAREGLPLDTVKTRLRRALELLRCDLDARHGGDRESWCLAVALLLRPAPPVVLAPPSGAAPLGSAALLPGVLSMKIASIALVSFSALCLVYFAVRPEGGSPPAPEGTTTAPLEARLVRAGDARESPTELAAAEGNDATEERVALVPEPVEVERTLARLRVVDGHGRPLAGVRAVLDGEDAAATSGPDGRAELELARPRSALERTLRLTLADHLPSSLHVDLTPTSTVDLGTFELQRGARVRGSVVGAAGEPVPGARIVLVGIGDAPWGGVRSPGASATSARHAVLADENGDFELAGLPAGNLRAWAGGAGYVDGCSGLLELTVGTELEGVVIRLGPAAGADEIAGRVALPDDVDPGEVAVWYRHVSDEGERTRKIGVDDLGRFRIALEERLPHDLWARASGAQWDEKRHVYRGPSDASSWRGVPAYRVPPGTSDLQLHFEPAPAVTVEVTDRAGRHFDPFVLGVVEFSGRDLRMEIPWFRDASSPARLSIPTGSFYVSLEAEGHERVVLGPFEPYGAEAIPDPLRAVLGELPPARGGVTADGRPVPGATVELFRPASRRHRTKSRGFLLRMNAAPTAEARTGEDGEFALTVRTPGEYFVRASAPGRAAAELGPVELDPEFGAEGLDLELPRGGSLEGRILAPPGVSPAGWIVGASRGDPYPRTFTTGPDGRYFFEGLTPGDWLVERAADLDGSTTIRSSDEPVVWAGNCRVEDGQATRFDLDLRDGERCVVQGRLHVGEHPAEGWLVSLRPGVTPGEGDDVDRVPVGSEGGFELVSERRGPHHLLFQGPENAERDVILFRILELDGALVVWSEVLEFGGLRGRIDPGLGAEDLAFLVQTDAGLSAMRLVPGPDGAFAESQVPVGAGRLHARLPDTEAELPFEWPLVGEVQIEAGEIAELEVGER